jgi:hypothetical protein
MSILSQQAVSNRTYLARQQRTLQALASRPGTQAGVTLAIDPKYFVDPDLQNPGNDRTLIRAQWVAGLEVTGTWSEAGGLVGPRLRVEAAQGTPDGAYIELLDTTLPRGTLTHTHTIPGQDLPWEGDVYLRVSVAVGTGQPTPSEPFLVHLDRLAPYEASGIEHPPAPVPQEGLVTDQELTGDFTVTIPGYADREPGDTVFLWLEKELPGSGTQPAPLVPAALVEAGDTQLAVPAQRLRDKGDGRFYLGCILIDKAGNRSALSQAAPVTLVLGTLPDTLQKPDVPAADPVIDRADAQAGVYVDVPEMPGWKPGDVVQVTFGSEMLAPYLLNPGSFQALVDVPAATLLAQFNNGNDEVSVDVAYTLARLDWVSAASPVTTALIDFRQAGPDNPGWPDPHNDDLPAVRVTSDDGSENEIPETDAGKAAILTFTVYPQAAEGETVEFFWGADALSTYALKVSDTPGTELEFNIPWALIAGTLDQDQVPVYYQVRLPDAPVENYQQAPDTLVDVSSLPLPAPAVVFTGADDTVVPNYLVLGCGALVDNAQGEPCIEVRLPDLSQPPYNQAAGDIVQLKWRGFSGMTLDGGILTPIPAEDDGELDESHTLVAADLTAAGFAWQVPYDPYGAVTYRYDGSPSSEGMLQVSYSITVNGKIASAPPTLNLITAFYDAGGPCSLALVAGCTTCRLG